MATSPNEGREPVDDDRFPEESLISMEKKTREKEKSSIRNWGEDSGFMDVEEKDSGDGVKSQRTVRVAKWDMRARRSGEPPRESKESWDDEKARRE